MVGEGCAVKLDILHIWQEFWAEKEVIFDSLLFAGGLARSLPFQVRKVLRFNPSLVFPLVYLGNT